MSNDHAEEEETFLGGGTRRNARIYPRFMSQREMAKAAQCRPANYRDLSSEDQWEIDKSLGILDYDPEAVESETDPPARIT